MRNCRHIVDYHVWEEEEEEEGGGGVSCTGDGFILLVYNDVSGGEM